MSEILTKINRAVTDLDIWNSIVHGAANAANVTTDGGSVPTVARAVATLMGASVNLVEVANTAARKNASSYSDGQIVANVLFVVQTDEQVSGVDTIVWHLVGSDVTSDASWHGYPLTNSSGELVGPIQIGTMTLAEVTGIVLKDGEIVHVTDENVIIIGDGTTLAQNLVPIGGRPLKTVVLSNASLPTLSPYYNYIVRCQDGRPVGDLMGNTAGIAIGQEITFVYESDPDGLFLAVRPAFFEDPVTPDDYTYVSCSSGFGFFEWQTNTLGAFLKLTAVPAIQGSPANSPYSVLVLADNLGSWTEPV